ncbi:MAG: YncE family protein [Hyphomicrobiales bacterium]
MIRGWGLASAAILAALTGAPITAASGPVPTDPSASPLERVAEIPLPGPPARFDYQSIDTTADRLYIAHMGAGRLLVFDLAARRVQATVAGLPRVTGVLAVPPLGKVYASAPGAHDVAVIDARTERITSRLGRIGFPDGLAYAPRSRRIFVSDESGGGEAVLDGLSDRVLTTIPLGGEAGNSIYDPLSDQVLVAVQTRDEVVAIDPGTERVTSHYAWAAAAHPHGMCLDARRHRLFVANEGNATLLMVALPSMRVLGTYPVGEGPDVLALDESLGLLYVASEAGTITVYSDRGRTLAREGEVRAPHAHTVAVDPRSHLLYVPLQDVGGRPVLRILKPR